jgi:hypothetical protein
MVNLNTSVIKRNTVFGVPQNIVLLIAGIIIIILGVRAILPMVFTGNIVGSGNPVTEDRSISGFTVVEAEQGFEVDISKGSLFRIEITADDNVIDKVRVTLSGNILFLGLEPGVYRSLILRAKITMPDLEELQLYGGSHGVVSGFQSIEEFKLGISGGGRVEITGSTDDLNLRASGGSEFDLSGFSAHDAYVNLEGGSHGTIKLDGKLDANLGGGSHLTYLGEPTLGDITESGGSTVRKG